MVVLNSYILVFFSILFGLLAGVLANWGLLFWFSWELGHVSLMSVNLELRVDWMAALFVATIFLISGCVGFFMNIYMSGEDSVGRFNVMLYLFILSMIVLVVASSMPVVMLGWDWLGVTSFLLVMYYEGKKSFDAAMITGLTNRIGDALLICSVAGMCFSFDLSLDMKPYCWSLIFVVGCVTKSAQIPFSSWLPAAMMAPTPVSSLVHSSTLVTAGIYLLIRSNLVWMSSSTACSLLVGAGLSTAVMAGVMAVTESDMKKVIALSTLSQLGLMAFSLGLGEIKLAFLHLLCHAFFKAGMFLSVGSMISYNSGNQSFSTFSIATMNLCPAAVLGLFMGSISLAGIPGTAGYISKESIIASSYSCTPWLSTVLLWLSVALTTLYSLRVILGLTSVVKSGLPNFTASREVFSLSVPGVVLVFMGLVGGELVLLSSSGGFFFESASSSEAWFVPYLMVLTGTLTAVSLKVFYSVFYELSFKWIYSMLFLDSVSRSVLGNKASTSFSYASKEGENMAEVVIPQTVLTTGLQYLSSVHNFIQRASVPSGIAAVSSLFVASFMV
uniref:NADH:ubiquinone reductase (H(+)-translocating) n=1 Tax=Ostrea denselamellosa TaxID=74434 RepID=F1ASY9_9BIVA|nr:NADH dehydrogenase subunit 5 [Ostrea denselamellosa]ADE18740.1 NADH dehydrogenase subunit 5 [Ostrea denselamellosa]